MVSLHAAFVSIILDINLQVIALTTDQSHEHSTPSLPICMEYSMVAIDCHVKATWSYQSICSGSDQSTKLLIRSPDVS